MDWENHLETNPIQKIEKNKKTCIGLRTIYKLRSAFKISKSSIK